MSDMIADPGEGGKTAPPVRCGEALVLSLAPVAPDAAGVGTGRPGAMAVRLWSGFIFAICGGMLGLGMWLTPSPTGVGTHEELGLLRCEFLARTGIPCPTCGCTTAVTHLAHGQVVQSFLTQPFGFLVGAVAWLLAPLSLIGLATGRWWGPSATWMNWHWRWWVYGGLGFLAGGWVYKIVVMTGHG